MFRSVFFFIAVLSSLLAKPSNGAEETKYPDYEFHTPRAFFIGDIHGDFNAYAQILLYAGLINDRAEWTGGNNTVVFLGDLNDRGKDTRLIWESILRLGKQAKAKGGHVRAVMGNHEVMILQGRVDYVHPEEAESFKEFLAPYPDVKNPLAAMQASVSGNTKFAEWYRNRNLIEIIRTPKKSFLVVHAYVDSWLVDNNLEEVNRTFIDWIKFYQKVGPQPPEQTEWVTDYPLWDHRLLLGAVNEKVVDAILAKYKVDHIVVGHLINKSLKIESRYNGKVIMVDTGISSVYEGKLTALEASSEGMVQNEIPRFKGRHDLYEVELNKIPLCERTWKLPSP